jgi:hypothetical protein
VYSSEEEHTAYVALLVTNCATDAVLLTVAHNYCCVGGGVADFPVKQLGAGVPGSVNNNSLEIICNMVFDYVRDMVHGNRLVITFAYRCSTDPPEGVAALHEGDAAHAVAGYSDTESEDEAAELLQASADAAALVAGSM